MAGNKSGALLLTNFRLTLGGGNEQFTIRLARGAVQDGDGKIGDERLTSHIQSHPSVTVIVATTRLGAVPGR